jgi:hypothetical protein
MKSDIGTFEVVLRPQQVAAMLQVTTKTLAQWRYQRRHLPFHKFGSSVARQSAREVGDNHGENPVSRRV